MFEPPKYLLHVLVLATGRPNPIGLTIHYERTARQSRNQKKKKQI